MTQDVEAGKAGQSFEDFLKEQGTCEETTERAVRRVLAMRISEVMKERNITKVEMARRLETSRLQLDRLLDPENEGATPGVLSRAAGVLGRSLKVGLR